MRSASIWGNQVVNGFELVKIWSITPPSARPHPSTSVEWNLPTGNATSPIASATQPVCDASALSDLDRGSRLIGAALESHPDSIAHHRGGELWASSAFAASKWPMTS